MAVVIQDGTGSSNTPPLAGVTSDNRLKVDSTVGTTSAPGMGFSGATIVSSGTMTNIFTPGTGSIAQLMAFSLSSDTAMKVSLAFSGGVPFGTWSMPASGTVAMNLIGAYPSGATNQPIGVSTSQAGSVFVSIVARSIL